MKSSTKNILLVGLLCLTGSQVIAATWHPAQAQNSNAEQIAKLREELAALKQELARQQELKSAVLKNQPVAELAVQKKRQGQAQKSKDSSQT